MRSAIIIGFVSLAAAAALPGCKSTGQTVFTKADRADPHVFAGDWRNDDGRVVTIRQTAAGGLRIGATGEDGPVEYTGMLIDAGGRTIVEVPLSDASQMANDAAPVSLFVRVWVAGDTLTSQPLRAEWLESHGSEEAGIVRAPLAMGEGRVTVGDAEAMRELLRQAAADDAAWGEPERYTRN